MSRTQFGRYIPSKNAPRTVFFIFSDPIPTDWWQDYLHGFTHVSFMEQISDNYALIFEPMAYRGEMALVPMPKPEDFVDFEVLKLRISPKNKCQIPLAVFQTCATMVQYLAGITLPNCFLVQRLYETLTDEHQREKLVQEGILEVLRWKVDKDSRKDGKRI